MMIDKFMNSELFAIVMTIGAYLVADIVVRRLKLTFINALLPAVLLIIGVIELLGIDYKTYEENSEFISLMLGPCVVSLGYVMHKNIKAIKSNIVPILASIGVGAVINLLIINLTFLITDIDKSIIYSAQPRSVTTPIAISLSEINGGIVSLTVIYVMVAGVLGSIIGPWLLKRFGVTDPIAQGVALGSSSHAIGTSRAIELGMQQGAMGGLAIGITGVITAILLSLFGDIMLNI